MMSTIAILATIVFGLITYWLYRNWKMNQYWKQRGVAQPSPMQLFRTSMLLMLGKITSGEFQDLLFQQYPNEPYIGTYDSTKPVLLVKDIDIIERMIIKDFPHFVDHGMPLDEERNPLDSNLFAMTGKRWKAVRNKLTPIFTTGRLKMMYENMANCGDKMIVELNKLSIRNVEMKDIIDRFSMDTLGSSVFGLNVDSLTNPDNEFRRMGQKVFQYDFITYIKLLILIQFPLLTKLFNITFSRPEVVNYFAKIIKQTVKHRREHSYMRNDFLQLMMQLQDKGYVEIHTKDPADDYLNIDHNSYSTEKFELTDEQLTGHAVNFLSAGHETTAATIHFTIYELSKNKEVQEKVRREVVQGMSLAGGSLTYDALKDMQYLDQCVKESLRMYPPTTVLMRLCTKEYTFPNGLTIEPGQSTMISIKVVHYDQKYYPEPEIFRPERFDPDQKIPPGAYIPFGNGPRMCIAMRFAMLEMKYCIAKLLANFNIELSPKTKQPLVLNKRSMITMPNDPIYFNINKLQE